MEAIRAFVAVELPSTLHTRLEALQHRLKKQGVRLRWVNPRNIHLTLKFLGDIPSSHVEPITAALKDIGSACASFSLSARGVGVFPGVRNARVLWVGLTGGMEALRGVHHQVEDRLETLGYPRENRRFNAHLTLARVKGRMDPRMLGDVLKEGDDFTSDPFEVTEMILFKSELKSTGAVYTPLGRAPLGGA